MLIAGIIISIVGLLLHLFSEFASAFCVGFQGRNIKALYDGLTTRERQLLDFARKKNMPVYGELLERLMVNRKIKVRLSF